MYLPVCWHRPVVIKFLSIVCLLILSLIASHVRADEIRIGVLAYRGTLAAVDSWQPTADYLTEKIPQHRFQVIPLGLEQLRAAASQGTIDFIITNTGEYVDLEVRYGISRIATLEDIVDGNKYTKFGAVIFVRADRKDIQSLEDLKGKSLMGVKKNGFGGFRMAWREMLGHGIDPFRDLSELKFSGFPQGGVAAAVLNGEVDAGTFRTGSLERMAAEGRIDLRDIRVLHPKTSADFPLLLSTKLYPTWPFAKLKHVGTDLAERVASELYKMTPDSPAAQAAQIHGWTIPMNYQPVHEILMFLKVGPYAKLAEVSLTVLIKRYWYWITICLGLFLVLSILTVSLYKENRSRKLAERQLTHHQEHLLELVHERTRDIVKMRDQAIAANEVKSVFLSTMSHELRTPLNAIIGYSELLLEDKRFTQDNSGTTELQKIHVSALHLLRVIDKILDITRIEDGSARLKIELFSLTDFIDDASNAVKPMAMENNNILEIHNNCPYETIQTDMLRLQEALIHILENACKFTENGKIILSVNAACDDGVDWIEFSVLDNGIGISPDQQDNIFDVFSQGDGNFNRQFEGIGVGLAICRSYCRIMGGDISFISSSGKGSEFIIRIPTVISKKVQRIDVA